MNKVPNHIESQLQGFQAKNRFRNLKLTAGLVDFTSNDYLGLQNWRSESTTIYEDQGSGGSRLLSGNHKIHENFEKFCANFYEGESALLFSNGYQANIGLISVIANRGDTLFYDAEIHASMRDGMRLAYADKVKFKHNDFRDLESKLKLVSGTKFVLAESLYSMEGELTDLEQLTSICRQNNAYLILDEAHSTGIYGAEGKGWTVEQSCQDKVWIRVHTFGKAIGRQGAIVLARQKIKDFLINKSRPFIFSTAPSPHQVKSLELAIEKAASMEQERKKLFELRKHAVKILSKSGLLCNEVRSPILPIVIPGTDHVKLISAALQEKGFDVRPIVAPTVAEGKERLRVILHAFNSEKEVNQLFESLFELMNINSEELAKP